MKYARIVLFLILTSAVACKPQTPPLTLGRAPEPMERMPVKIRYELCSTGLCEVDGKMTPCWDDTIKECHAFKWPAGTPEGEFLRRYVEQQDKLRCMENPNACPRPTPSVATD